MSRTPFLWYFWIMGCSLLAGCSDEAALRRWERQWQQTPRSTYPADAVNAIPSAEAVRLEIRQHQALAEKFRRIRPANLENKSRKSWKKYAAELNAALEIRTRLTSDPAIFHLGETLAPILQQDKGSPDERIQHLETCLENAPAYYETARLLLEHPDPEGTILAIENQLQTLRLLRESLPGLLEKADMDADTRKRLQGKIYRARLALKDYLAFCQSCYFEHSDTTLVPELRTR